MHLARLLEGCGRLFRPGGNLRAEWDAGDHSGFEANPEYR